MDTDLSWESLEAMVAERRRQIEAAPAVSVRFASRHDAPGLRRLAELDSGPVPTGTALVAEVEGRLVAALPLGGGRALADPFQPTAGIVRLLELRAAQLRGRDRRRRRSRAPAAGGQPATTRR
jgi:hypothetical protein